MLRIALAQINTTVGDLEGNVNKILRSIRRARELAVDVVVFPELTITGYPPEDLLLKERFIAENIRALRSIIPAAGNITAIIGFVDKRAEGIFNAAAVINDGHLKGIYHKQQLPNYGVFDEKRYFTPGNDSKIFRLNETVLGVNICEDIWVSSGPWGKQARSGAKLLINLSSSPYHFAKDRTREEVLRNVAKKNKVHVAYVNLVGGQDELVFDGRSMILDPKGNVVAAGAQFEEDMVIADLDVPAKNKKHDSRIRISGHVAKRLGSSEEIFRALVLGTRDYILKNGFKKAVIGLSGGIDSALVAMIAREAIGRENVVGVSMPSPFSSKETRADARSLARNLGIRFLEVPIKGIFSTYLFVLQNIFEGQKTDITEENLQARIRGNILMALSNKFGWLVLTTGNKSEFAVGYCTLYGDMSGGFAVIKDVPKTKVYEITRFINKMYGKMIPESIVRRAPTAELRPNQKDQDTLPPYDVLDDILKDYVENHRSVDNISRRHYSRQVVSQVAKMVDRSEYKRRQSPPGIKITSRAFGKDWRLPITNKYKEF